MQILRKHIAILLSLYIFGFGCGVNLFDYCCTACEDYGSSYFSFVDCEEVHESHDCNSHHGCGTQACGHVHDMNMTYAELCEHLSNSSEHCSLHRLTLPTTELIAQQIIQVEQPLLYVVEFPQNEAPVVVLETLHFADTSPPIPRSGRELIALHATLLI